MCCRSCGAAASVTFPDFSAWAGCNGAADCAGCSCRCGRLGGLCGFLGLC